jgi:hypothetical protein
MMVKISYDDDDDECEVASVLLFLHNNNNNKNTNNNNNMKFTTLEINFFLKKNSLRIVTFGTFLFNITN